MVPLRGNVDTRLRKLDDGEADAIVLAAAGLLRLGLGERIGFLFDPAEFVPEAGQGALAVQVRAGEEQLVAALDHGPSRELVEAERARVAELGGGCTVPVAAHAWHEDGEVRHAHLDGRMTVYLVGAGPGDPGLLTLRGRELLERCDALVYDRLADPRIVAMARPGAELHDAGKQPGRHTMTQEEINELLVELGGRQPDGGPAQGRRPVHLRPRRRGGAGAGRGRHRLGGRARHLVGLRRARLRGHPGHAARRWRRRSRSSPATRIRRSRAPTSTGRTWRGRRARWSS